MVTVFLWNIDLTPDLSITNFFRGAKERYPKIAQVLNQYDIVVLNEAFLYRKELLKLVVHQYTYTDDKPWYKFFNSGVVILSKFPFTAPQYHHYIHNSYWDKFISKGILKVTFDIDGKGIDLYGTHMQQYNDKEAQIARKAQVYEVIDFVKKTNFSKNDIILVGDLNMGPVYDKTYQQLPVYYSDSTDARLRDEQYELLVTSLQLNEYVDSQDICHLLHKGVIDVKKMDIPDYKLSDTGAYCLQF